MAAHTNIQVAVDAKNNMIVEQAVTNQVVDMGLLTQPPSRPAPFSMRQFAPVPPAALRTGRASRGALRSSRQGFQALDLLKVGKVEERADQAGGNCVAQSRGHRGLRDPKRVRDAYARRGT